MTRLGGSDAMSTIKSVSFQEHGVDPVNSQKSFHIPRIILHDKLGNKLDTHTRLQEAIYRDKWNVNQTHEARKPNEWRLPKAPPPAKPDLSRRVVPDSRHRRFYCKDDLDISSRHKKETDVGDVDYVAKRHYLKIAFGSFTEKKYLSETTKQDSSYVFPGFWTGCIRKGKESYARNALPHTHRGSQTRSGGGFAYWKHDRAESEISGKESWGLYTTSSSGEPMSRTRSASTDVSSVEVYFLDGKKRLVMGHDDGAPLDDQFIEELYTMEIWDNIIDSDCDHVLYQDESGVQILIHKNNLQQIQDLMPPNHPDREKVQDLLDISDSSNRLSVPRDIASRLGTMSSSSLRGMSNEKGHLVDFIDSLESRSSNLDSKDGSSVDIYLVDGQKRLVLGNDKGVPLDDQTIEELCTMEIWDNIIDSDCDHVLYQDESGVQILIHKNNLQQIQDLMPPNHPDREKVQDLLDISDSSNRLSVPRDIASRLGTMSSSSLRGMSNEKGHLVDFIDSLESRSSNLDSKDGSSVDIYLVDGQKRLVLGNDKGVPLDDQTIEELCTMEIWDNIIDSDRDHVLYKDKSGIEILIHNSNLQQIQDLMPPNHPDREKVQDLLDIRSNSSNRLSVPRDIASRLGTMSSTSLSGMSNAKGHLMDFIEKRSSSLNCKDEELSVSRKGSQYKDVSSVEVYLVEGKKRLVLGNADGVPLDDHTIKELCTIKIWDNIIDSDCDHVLYQDESGVEILIHKNNLQQIQDLMPPNDPDREKVQDLLDISDSSNRLSVPLVMESRLGTMSSSSLRGMSNAEGHLMDFIEPKAFKLKERERKQLIAQSPFSTNRQYNIPKGPGFKIQKSTKELTQFINIDKGDGSWKEPTKFELQKYEREMADFIRIQKNEDGKRNRSGRADDERDGYDRALERLGAPLSPDTGLDSEFRADSFKRQTVDSDGDDVTKMISLDDSVKGQKDDSVGDDITNVKSLDDLERGEIGDHNIIKADREQTDGSLNGEIQEKPRKGRKKKPDQNSEKTRKGRKKTLDQNGEKTPLSTSSGEKGLDKQKDSDTGIKDALRLTSPHVTMTTPDLPQIEQKRKVESKRNMEYAIEAPPVMKQPPKIRKPPPTVRTLPDMKRFKRRRKRSEARVSAEGLKEIQDPLDFLAKYCIINPARLPFYEFIFEAAVVENKPEFPVPYLPQVDYDEPPVHHASHQQQSSLSDHEKTMIKDMTLVSHGLQPPLVGYSVSEQCLEKINFTMETLHGKKEEMEKKLMELEAKRIKLLVKLAKEEFPGIDGVNYSQKKNKGKKKKPKPSSSIQKGKITDETVIERLDTKNLAKLCSKTDIRLVDIEIERIRQKIKDVTFRQNQLKDEKNMLLGYCEDDFINRQFTERHSKDLRRKQSDLYNTLRPTPDYEITLDNLRESLQKVNNHLLTDRECEFLYQVLDLPGRERINFRLFSVVAALSEKVTQLDPMVRRLMNKHDYKALDIKMEKCRELFSFLEDDIAPPGEATAASLSLELTAGGLKQEHINYVLGKFNREGQGLIDFMDFVTYVPLFVEIHQRIIKDPLSEDRDL